MQITCAVLRFARRSFKDCKQTWRLDVGRYGKGEKWKWKHFRMVWGTLCLSVTSKRKLFWRHWGREVDDKCKWIGAGRACLSSEQLYSYLAWPQVAGSSQSGVKISLYKMNEFGSLAIQYSGGWTSIYQLSWCPTVYYIFVWPMGASAKSLSWGPVLEQIWGRLHGRPWGTSHLCQWPMTSDRLGTGWPAHKTGSWLLPPYPERLSDLDCRFGSLVWRPMIPMMYYTMYISIQNKKSIL